MSSNGRGGRDNRRGNGNREGFSPDPVEGRILGGPRGVVGLTPLEETVAEAGVITARGPSWFLPTWATLTR